MKNYNKVRNGAPTFTAAEVSQAEAICSAKSVQTTNNTNTTEVKTMTNSNTAFALDTAARKGFKFDFAARTINNRVVRNRVIVKTVKWVPACKGGAKVPNDVFTLISYVPATETTEAKHPVMSFILNIVKDLTAKETKGFFKRLEQALFVETVGYGNPEALSELPTDIQVANAHRAYVVTKIKSAYFAVSLTGEVVSQLLAQTDLSVCPDKKVEKAVLIGDGAIAAGVYRDGNTLTSVNPLTDATKGITRCNAGFAGKAYSADRVVSSLQFEGNNSNFVKEGIAHQAIFVPGLAVLAQGMIAVNETKSFDYEAAKNFDRKFAVETIGEAIDTIECPDFLVHGTEVIVNGVVIYTHESFTEVEVTNMTSKLDELGSVWTFSFEATMVAVHKTNVKARDFGAKGMTHRNGVTVEESNSWDLLFTSESIKTSEAIRTMYTQANKGHLQAIDGRLLDVNGNEVTSSQINAWYRANGQYFTVTTPVHASCVDQLKAVTANKVTFTSSDVEGIFNATQTVFGIQAEYLVNIELSSADEIAGFSKTDAVAKTLQAMITA